MALWYAYGRAGRLTAKNGSFRPGQDVDRLYSADPRTHPDARPLDLVCRCAENMLVDALCP